MGYLQPDTDPLARPSLPEMRAFSSTPTTEEQINARGRILYLKSYLLMRTVIGAIGVALPILLFAGDAFWLTGTWRARGSLSACYHSGMRDVFVGSLIVTGIFLITYKVFDHTLDNTLSTVAGVAALGVALFPTSRPPTATVPPTPLEVHLGEGHVAVVHYSCAGVFIVLLGVMCVIFGVREGKRTRQRVGRQARLSPTFWRWFHWETGTVFAFGVSWFMKGMELDILLGPWNLGVVTPTEDAAVQSV